MATIPAAYPYIEVNVDTSALQAVAQRSPGVLAIVGSSADSAGTAMGTAPPDTPLEVDVPDDARTLFGTDPATHSASPTALSESLLLALQQDPAPSKLYGVAAKTDGNGLDYAGALAALEGVDDVTFVSLADEAGIGALTALKEHVEAMSSAGLKRMGVAMVDPAIAKATDYVTQVTGRVGPLKSDDSRMVLVAARGSQVDVAAAAAAAIAGYDPQVSIVLKQVRGVTVDPATAFGPAEIKGLSEAGINPIVSPSLIIGGGAYFGDGRAYTTDSTMPFVDIVRVLDQIDFELRAGLLGSMGDARITKSGMILLKARTERILGPLAAAAVIDGYEIEIGVLDVLTLPESSWTDTQRSIVTTARANRTVDMTISITYGPAVHRLLVRLAPQF